MGTLSGLDGINGRELPAVFFNTSRQALSRINKETGLIAAGDTGSISVWMDDEDNYRAHFSRGWVVRGESVFKTKKALKDWLDEWMPHMQASYPPLPSVRSAIS